MIKIFSPPCNSLEATSFIMSDERENRVKVVMGGQSSRHVDDCGAVPEVGVPLTGQFLPDLFILHEAVVDEGVRGQMFSLSSKSMK